MFLALSSNNGSLVWLQSFLWQITIKSLAGRLNGTRGGAVKNLSCWITKSGCDAIFATYLLLLLPLPQYVAKTCWKRLNLSFKWISGNLIYMILMRFGHSLLFLSCIFAHFFLWQPQFSFNYSRSFNLSISCNWSLLLALFSLLRNSLLFKSRFEIYGTSKLGGTGPYLWIQKWQWRTSSLKCYLWIFYLAFCLVSFYLWRTFIYFFLYEAFLRLKCCFVLCKRLLIRFIVRSAGISNVIW